MRTDQVENTIRECTRHLPTRQNSPLLFLAVRLVQTSVPIAVVALVGSQSGLVGKVPAVALFEPDAGVGTGDVRAWP